MLCCVHIGVKRTKQLLKLSNLNQNKWRPMSQIGMPPETKTLSQFSVPKGILGQPTCHTHPHMISQGHLTCGITQMEYKDRRDTLVSKLVAEVNNVHQTHIVSVILN